MEFTKAAVVKRQPSKSSHLGTTKLIQDERKNRLSDFCERMLNPIYAPDTILLHILSVDITQEKCNNFFKNVNQPKFSEFTNLRVDEKYLGFV